MSLSDIEKLQEENKALRAKLNQCSSSVDRLNIIIDSSFEWIWEVNAEGIYTYASEHVQSILGYTPDELLGKTPFDFMSEDEAKRVRNIFLEITSQGKSFSKLHNTCLHKDGHTVYTETSGQPIYDEENLLVGYRGIDFDRTTEASQTQTLKEKNTSLELALNAKHELLLNVTNSISDLLFYKDTDFRYTGCNQAFSSFLGLPIDFIIGKTDYELFSKEHADLFRSMDKRAIEGLEEYSNHEWVVHADGRELYLFTQKSPLFNSQASLIGMVGIARDVTKEHKLEEKIKESHTQLIDAQSIAQVGHWEWNITDGRLIWSDEIYKIFGYTPQEVEPTYDAFLATIHPDDREKVSTAVNKAVKAKEDYNIFHRIILPDGSQKTVHEIGHAIYDAKSIPIQMIGTVQDITKFKKIETELAQQKESFESIFEYSSDGAFLLSEEGFIACNQSVIQMFKAKSKDEILQLHPSQISPELQPDGKSSYKKAEEMMGICQQSGRNHFEWMHTRLDGEEFWSEILLTRIEISNKPIIHASIRDISERKLLENNLETSNTRYQDLVSELDNKVKEQSEQMIKQSRMAQMGELLSMIAHQWRQPLGSITAITSSIKVKLALMSDDSIDKKSNEFLNQQMDDIEFMTQSLSSTINDFRTLYKPDKLMNYVQINNPVERALKLMKVTLNENTIDIKTMYHCDTTIQMHTNQLMQVILNLFKNSEDNFLEKKIDNPTISIETSENDKYMLINVCDNGGGIDSTIIDSIFDPYFSTKNDKNGTGLGLYMSKIIVEQHHKGKLDVYNKDEGVCFSIQLPKE